MNTSALKDSHHTKMYSQVDLNLENQRFDSTGGVSENNRDEGFLSAFRDTATGLVYRSRFSNGMPAPIHLLDGLPNELVVQRNADGRVTAVKPTLVAGFLRANCFYTREQAAEFTGKID